MARIEISMKEYEAKNERIKALEKEVTKLLKENEDLKYQVFSMSEKIELLKESSCFERLFNWKTLCQNKNS